MLFIFFYAIKMELYSFVPFYNVNRSHLLINLLLFTWAKPQSILFMPVLWFSVYAFCILMHIFNKPSACVN